jgi:hypothetical protein
MLDNDPYDSISRRPLGQAKAVMKALGGGEQEEMVGWAQGEGVLVVS